MTARQLPTVSVIIVDLNGGAMLDEAIQSVLSQSHAPTEFVLVDNGSSDGAARSAVERYGDRLQYLRNEENLGFATANNQAFERITADWAFLLNNDAVLAPGVLEALMRAAADSDDLGMLACRVVKYDEPHVFDSVGLSIYPDGVCRTRGWDEKDRGQYDRREEVLAPHGAAAAYRMTMLNEVGGFDPDYFAYLEDMDLALRAQLEGWRCEYIPESLVRHRKSATFGNYSRFKAYHVERNRIYTAIKLLPRFLLVISPLFTLNRYLLQFYAARTHLGLSSDFVKEYSWVQLSFIMLRAYGSALLRLPHLIRQRRAINARRTISKEQWYHLFSRFKLDAIELALKF